MADPKILLINNNREITNYLKEKLAAETGFSLSLESNGPAGIEAFKNFNFDLVIMKQDMPYFDASDTVNQLRKLDPDVVIIALLENDDPDLIKNTMQLGIYDFISLPIDDRKLDFLVKKGVDLHTMSLAHRKLQHSIKEQNLSLQKQNTLLAKRIEDSTKNLTRLYEDLRSTYMRTIRALAQAIDARDHYTHSHSQNVAKYATLISEEMHLSAKDIELIREACELHDLGKIGIQDNILIKPAELNKEEWELMKRHPLTGAQILEPLTFLHGVIELIRQHHEHYDGTGYPDGLKGDQISLGARIIHLADAYEAMTSARSYRKIPLTKEAAIREIERNNGTQFDPKVVECFLKVVDRI
ncbi:MAG: HD domain-containing protein [Candidatus Omnitrophica bacterium]|nr:HD domain-containing protein [Candidatus Omnitrophota bacterium]